MNSVFCCANKSEVALMTPFRDLPRSSSDSENQWAEVNPNLDVKFARWAGWHLAFSLCRHPVWRGCQKLGWGLRGARPRGSQLSQPQHELIQTQGLLGAGAGLLAAPPHGRAEPGSAPHLPEC